MKHVKFVVTRFENRNGVTSWRVDGRLHGVRIRKNFKTREEAAAEQAALDLKALQLAKGMRAVPTSLAAHPQVHSGRENWSSAPTRPG